jgi:hypothetical protein
VRRAVPRPHTRQIHRPAVLAYERGGVVAVAVAEVFAPHCRALADGLGARDLVCFTM